jgi:coenzyme F420 hydrogenase subunit delta
MKSRKNVIVLGCGNVLLGDDGFGSRVAEHLLREKKLPPNVDVLDVGTGAGSVLFDLLWAEEKPKRLIVVDAYDFGGKAGEVIVVTPEQLPRIAVKSFSAHQAPTSGFLEELNAKHSVEVFIVACQVKRVPEEVSVGLSEEVAGAIPKACEEVVRLCTKEA